MVRPIHLLLPTKPNRITLARALLTGGMAKLTDTCQHENRPKWLFLGGSLAVGCALWSGLIGCSAETETEMASLEATSEEGLVKGAYASSSESPAIGFLATPARKYAAALIGPHTVVTACHVVHRLKANQLTWQAPSGDSRRYGVTRITCFNRGNDVNTTAEGDIATLELDGSSTVRPLEVTSQLPPPGAAVALWGTGCQNRTNPGADWPARQKFGFRFRLNPQGDGPTTTAVCPGDSGGPFVWNGKVFAVVHDWHHTGTASRDYDSFARVLPGW